jgi:hypothetical protein
MYNFEQKWIASLTAAVSMVLVGVLAGCGDDDGGSQPDASAPDAGAPDGGGAGDGGVCPGPEELWGDVDIEEFTALPGLEALGTEGSFTLAEPATYWELRRGRPDGLFQVITSVGEKCNDAENPDVCRSEFDDMAAGSGFGGSCPPGICFGYIAVNRENTNSLIITPEELVAFLGTIDSPSEAALIAFAHGYYWDESEVSAGSARVSEQGFELLVTELVQDCDPIITDRVQVQVSAAGELTPVRQQRYRVSCGACI